MGCVECRYPSRYHRVQWSRERIRDGASVLARNDPDVAVLQEVDSCETLAVLAADLYQATGRTYHLFLSPASPPDLQRVGILSIVEPSGGFGYTFSLPPKPPPSLLPPKPPRQIHYISQRKDDFKCEFPLFEGTH